MEKPRPLACSFPQAAAGLQLEPRGGGGGGSEPRQRHARTGRLPGRRVEGQRGREQARPAVAGASALVGIDAVAAQPLEKPGRSCRTSNFSP